MNTKVTLALAQSIPEKGDVAENIRRHERLIRQAAGKGAALLAFPELSLTGYEPEDAAALAFTPEDERLQPLKTLACSYQMIVIVGAPLREADKLYIAAFAFYPDNSTKIYTKHYLHPGEDKVFVPGTRNPAFQPGEERLALAICADIANPKHARDAASAGSKLYLASAFISEGGYQADAQILSNIARQYRMLTMMVNFGGNSGGFSTGGRTAVWSEEGEVLAQAPPWGEALVMVQKEKQGGWSACCIAAEAEKATSL